MKSLAVLLTGDQEKEIAKEIEESRNLLLQEICYADIFVIGKYLRAHAPTSKSTQEYAFLEGKFNGSPEKNIAQVQNFFKSVDSSWGNMNKWNILDDLVEAEDLNAHREKLSSLKRNWYATRNKLVQPNIPMLLKEANKFCRSRNEYDHKDGFGEIVNPRERKEYFEMVNLGYKGLITAADKFDPDRNVRFYTYAINWIKHYMGRGSLKETKVGFFGPNLESLHEPACSEKSAFLKIDNLADRYDLDEEAQQHEIQEKVRRGLEELQLQTKDLKIITLRFDHGLSLREVGKEMGLSHQTVKNVISRLQQSTFLRALYEESV